jgi:CBS domain-containing protein
LKPEGTAAVARIAADTLRPHPPFNAMSEEALGWIGARANLAYFHEGEEIVGPAGGPVTALHIVKQGVVQARASKELPSEDLADLVHGPGECFPVGALLGRRPTAYHYVASGDVFTYELAEADVRHLFDASPPFRAFCTDHLAALLEQSRRVLRAHAGERLLDEGRLIAPLREVCSSPAVSCTPATPVREALHTMRERRIGSVVIADPDGSPLGIFTNVDVLERVALAERTLDTPMADVMSAPVAALEATAPAYAAAQLMAERGIRHVVVVEEGRLHGIVSERDLFALQRISAGKVAKAIRAARGIDELVAAAAGVRELTGRLLAGGVDAAHLTPLISSLNDALARAAIGLEARRHRIAGRYCWLAFGSEGRSEQTLATDQDNGLILEEGAARAPFLHFALEVNHVLDRCGFPLCKGGVMASNERWCLPLSEWRATFADWIRNPVPGALLGAGIFFDFRALAGETDFARELRDMLLEHCADNRAFLRAMAANALDVRPPVGLLGGFETREDGTLNLKTGGTRIFVDAARVWSLARRLPQTGTAERLAALSQAGGLPREEASSAAQAFHAVQALRLRHQYFDAPAPGSENSIDPERLTSVERRVLKEAFRLAGRLQQRLRLDFAL